MEGIRLVMFFSSSSTDTYMATNLQLVLWRHFSSLPEICLLKALPADAMGLSKSDHQFLKKGSLKKSSLTTVATYVLGAVSSAISFSLSSVPSPLSPVLSLVSVSLHWPSPRLGTTAAPGRDTLEAFPAPAQATATLAS